MVLSQVREIKISQNIMVFKTNRIELTTVVIVKVDVEFQ